MRVRGLIPCLPLLVHSSPLISSETAGDRTVSILVHPCDLDPQAPICQDNYQKTIGTAIPATNVHDFRRLTEKAKKGTLSREELVRILSFLHKVDVGGRPPLHGGRHLPEQPSLQEDEIVGRVTGNGSGRNVDESSSSSGTEENPEGNHYTVDNEPDEVSESSTNSSESLGGDVQHMQHYQSPAPPPNTPEESGQSSDHAAEAGTDISSQESNQPGGETNAESSPSLFGDVESSSLPVSPEPGVMDGLSQEVRSQLSDMLVAGPSRADEATLAQVEAQAESFIEELEQAMQETDADLRSRKLSRVMASAAHHPRVYDRICEQVARLGEILIDDWHTYKTSTSEAEEGSIAFDSPDTFEDLRNTSELSWSFPTDSSSTGHEAFGSNPEQAQGVLGGPTPSGQTPAKTDFQAGVPMDERDMIPLLDIADGDESDLYSSGTPESHEVPSDFVDGETRRTPSDSSLGTGTQSRDVATQGDQEYLETSGNHEFGSGYDGDLDSGPDEDPVTSPSKDEIEHQGHEERGNRPTDEERPAQIPTVQDQAESTDTVQARSPQTKTMEQQPPPPTIDNSQRDPSQPSPLPNTDDQLDLDQPRSVRLQSANIPPEPEDGDIGTLAGHGADSRTFGWRGFPSVLTGTKPVAASSSTTLAGLIALGAASLNLPSPPEMEEGTTTVGRETQAHSSQMTKMNNPGEKEGLVSPGHGRIPNSQAAPQQAMSSGGGGYAVPGDRRKRFSMTLTVKVNRGEGKVVDSICRNCG